MDSPASPPSSRLAITPASANNYVPDYQDDVHVDEGDNEVKRSMEQLDLRPAKKMRMDIDEAMPMAITPLAAPLAASIP